MNFLLFFVSKDEEKQTLEADIWLKMVIYLCIKLKINFKKKILELNFIVLDRQSSTMG